MTVNVTPISELTPLSTPCTVAARVKLVRPAPQTLVSWEGTLKDDSGETIFSVWKDSGTGKLRPGKRYLFYNAEVGRREGRLEVRVQSGCRVFPAESDERLGRLLERIGCREDRERQQLARRSKITPRDRARRDPFFFRAVVTAGVLIVLASAVLVLSGIVTEEKIRDWLISRTDPAPPVPAETTIFRGRAVSVEPDGSVRVEVEGEEWTVHFLGIEVPPRSSDRAAFDPLTERTYSFLGFAVEGREVELEMEPWLPPEGSEAWAYVFVGDRFINAELLERGFARARPEPPEPLAHGGRLERAEQNARERGIGVWTN